MKGAVSADRVVLDARLFLFLKLQHLIVLSRCFRANPLTQVQVFLNLPSFVPVLQCLFRLIIHFAEGMFRVTNSFTDDL